MRLGGLTGVRGASSLLLASLTGLVVLTALTAVDCGAVVVAGERARAAADAAAHDAVVALAGDPARDDLSVALLSGTTRCDAGPFVEPSDPCRPAVDAARATAVADGGVAVDVRLGPDLRDVGRQAASGRVVAVVVVAVRLRLPVASPHCEEPPPARSDLCWSVAVAAAQEAG